MLTSEILIKVNSLKEEIKNFEKALISIKPEVENYLISIKAKESNAKEKLAEIIEKDNRTAVHTIYNILMNSYIEYENFMNHNWDL